MAHFFKYQNRVMHSGTSEAKVRDERREKLRQMGMKAGNGQISKSHGDEVKAKRLQDLAMQKKIREINKRSAITKTLNKFK